MTGKLFPTGNRSDIITVKERSGTRFSVQATLIDAANPFVVVDETSLPPYLKTASKDTTGYLEHMESIRRAGAVMMGLASSTDAAAKVRGTPKLAIVSAPKPENANDPHVASIHVLAFSMGKPHPSLQLTGAACLASAVCIDGTVAFRAASNGAMWDPATPERTPSPVSEHSESSSAFALMPDRKTVRISHSSGAIEVDVAATSSESFAVVERCVVSRTARRLFEGKVYYYQNEV